jgi:tetratricopeptide (TPR) repeat protein
VRHLVVVAILVGCGANTPKPSTPASVIGRSTELRLQARWSEAGDVIDGALRAGGLDDDATARLLIERAAVERERGTYQRFERKAEAANALDDAAALLPRASAATRAAYAEERGWIAYSAAFRDEGTFDDAMPMFAEAQALRERGDDPRALAWSWFEVGLVHYQSGRLDDAEQIFARGLALTKEHALAVERGYFERHLGGIVDDRGDVRGSIPYFERSLAIREEAGHRWGVVFAAITLADVVKRAGDPTRARGLLERAKTLADELDVHLGAASAAEELATFDEEAGDQEAACAWLSRARAAWVAYGEPKAIAAVDYRAARCNTQ